MYQLKQHSARVRERENVREKEIKDKQARTSVYMRVMAFEAGEVPHTQMCVSQLPLVFHFNSLLTLHYSVCV